MHRGVATPLELKIRFDFTVYFFTSKTSQRMPVKLGKNSHKQSSHHRHKITFQLMSRSTGHTFFCKILNNLKNLLDLVRNCAFTITTWVNLNLTCEVKDFVRNHIDFGSQGTYRFLQTFHSRITIVH